MTIRRKSGDCFTLESRKAKENKQGSQGFGELPRTGMQGCALDLRAKMTQNLPQFVPQRFAL